MSATLRRTHSTLKVCSSPLLSPSPTSNNPISSGISLPPNTFTPQLTHSCHCSCSSALTPTSISSSSFDFLNQFSPFCVSPNSSDNVTTINSNERRRIVLGLARMIKQQQAHVLKVFSQNFCPFLLVEIMKLFGNRQISFAFFKFYSSGDDYSEGTVRACCMAAHLLAAEGLRPSAQDLLSWVLARIGLGRSWEVVEYMCSEHYKYETNFSVLDSLMRAFLNVDMVPRAMEMVDRMREVGVKPSSSAVNILFKLLLRIGDYGSVWKLFRDMVDKGPRPSNYTFNVMILGFVRKGYLEIGEYLSYMMEKFQLEPDVYAYNILINAYCIRGRTSDGLALLRFMIERGCNPSNFTFNTLINALCMEGNVVEASKLFHGIQEMGVFPNTIMYNTLINGYVKARDIDNVTTINPNERRRIVLGLVRMIKQQQAHVLKGFSQNFCPFLLVEIMKLFGNRQISFAFFKFYSSGDDYSEGTVRACCMAAHLLAAEGLRLLAQDLLSCVLARIGLGRSWEVVEYMCSEQNKYETNFSVLDSLMRAFLNVDMVPRAMEMVDRMREVGVKPSSSAVSILFKLLLRIGDYGSVWKLFRDMVDKGPRPSNYTFNVMILGFVRKGYLEIGEYLSYMMEKFQLEPDVYAYNILINAYCIRGRTSDGLALLRFMIERGCNPSNFTFNTLINALCMEGNVVEASKLFHGIQEMGVFPNTIMYNTLINGYVKARDIGQANMLYEEMRNAGVPPDGVTFNILVAGHYRYGREEDGDRLLRDLSVSGLLPDSSLSDISVAGLCWAGRLDEAMGILEEMLEKGMRVSLIAFNSVIAAYSGAGVDDRAFEAYKLMVNYGLSPSSSTCSSLLMALCGKGRLLEARELMNGMIDKGFPVNKVAFTVLLDGCFKMGDIPAAQSLWEEMERRGMSPDAVAYSAIIDGLSKAGLVEEAYSVFLKMSKKGFVPNNYAYNSLIGGFVNCGRLSEALKLEKEMRQRGLVPDVFTINIIINGFCKQGRMKSAVDTFMDMYRMGLTPDIVTYNTLISGYCKAFDMVNLDNFVNKLHASGWDPDITTYNVRIHGCCSSQRMNQAVMMLDELVSSGVVPNTVTYNTMMTGVCNDILDRAMILTAKLLKMAFVPNIVTTNLLLSHLCKQGLPERTLMWGQKLSEICVDFDEITFKILDRAYHDIQEDAHYSRGTSGKSLFLDFLMYITYDYLCRYRSPGEKGRALTNAIGNLDILDALNKLGHELEDVVGQVARDEDLMEQIGRDMYFDLVDHNKVRSFRIERQMPFNLFKGPVKAIILSVRVLYRVLLRLAFKLPVHLVNVVVSVKNDRPWVLELQLLCLVFDRFLHLLRVQTAKDILLFFKLYDPLKEELSYVGRLYVKASGKQVEIFSKINGLAGFAPDEDIELFELEDGDIICFQKSSQAECFGQCGHPDAPSFLDYVNCHQIEPEHHRKRRRLISSEPEPTERSRSAISGGSTTQTHSTNAPAGKIRFLAYWISSEASLLLERVLNIHKDTFTKFSIFGLNVQTLLLESFASFIEFMSTPKVNEVQEDVLRQATLAIKDFEHVGLELWWLKKRLEEAKLL
ncbi:hypothetical protein RHSIM_Rhsim05G0178700 [Rhododendron simsii]|uniref:Ubiquitin carboxyl-terminal hydrolase 7 ICP0-binding domain-containing protein n=1 Tax=Rhododendron simsii TaxID=118357 RepID=A0A834H6X9_RHOSS|nr:hypothetical protein RHSIM_Rhsim05G0178700 [Rhododendron simsii]